MGKNSLKSLKEKVLNIKSIKTIVFSALFTIIVLNLFSSLPGLYRSYKDFRQAQLVTYLNDISDNLFAAVGNYGFERGRVNVVLNDAGPVENMEENRQFIFARRKQGDIALSDALEGLHQLKSKIIKEKIIELKSLKENIIKFRQKTGKDLILTKNKRDNGLAEIWFAAMTEYIERIEELLVTISRDISDTDGKISRYSSLKQEILALRNTAGPEVSILTATILSGKPIKENLVRKIESLHVITAHHFQRISFLCQGFSTPVIPDALKILKDTYFSDYIPYRNKIFPLAQTGGPYPYSQEAFLGHGVEALNGIADFMEVVVSETKTYAAEKLNHSRKQIFVYSICSIGSLMAILLIFLYINFKVIKPIGWLTTTVRRLIKKDLDVTVPMLDVQNELGEMARAFETFKKMSFQLEKDNHLLKIAEEKIRSNEEKLRIILNSLPDMILEINAELKIIWANKAALDLNPKAIGQTCYSAFSGNKSLCEGCGCIKAFETEKIEAGIIHQPASETAEDRYWETVGIPLKGLRDDRITVLEVSRDITDRVKNELEKEKLISDLRDAFAQVKQLSGLLPICAKCKKIRDDKGYWNNLEEYIQTHSDVSFSHGICSECSDDLYGKEDWYIEMKNEENQKK